jgi:3-oxoacyl-[acyl-carrier-protein] synthase-1
VVSNACISGVAAMLLARRLITSGRYRHAIVVGADLVSRFIVSGFQSFLSLSDEPCRPFDAARKGLTLGEAASTMVFTARPGDVCLLRGASSNDANHISGPSRTGEGLYQAIIRTLKEGELPDLVSAHGTATRYNDEMESIALARSGLEGIPVNSLKGCLGHTLGTAGIIETVLNLAAAEQEILLPTLGYEDHGVSSKIRVQKETGKGEVRYLLKIASGFGGCNAAALFRRSL